MRVIPGGGRSVAERKEKSTVDQKAKILEDDGTGGIQRNKLWTEGLKVGISDSEFLAEYQKKWVLGPFWWQSQPVSTSRFQASTLLHCFTSVSCKLNGNNDTDLMFAIKIKWDNSLKSWTQVDIPWHLAFPPLSSYNYLNKDILKS